MRLPTRKGVSLTLRGVTELNRQDLSDCPRLATSRDLLIFFAHASRPAVELRVEALRLGEQSQSVETSISAQLHVGDQPAGRPALSSVRPSQEQGCQQLQRILRSSGFRNAHTLQHLLQFLVAQAYGPDAESLKESTIGVEVFGRRPDFDPKVDPVVRVQVHRLRRKLQEYYETEGKRDPFLIEIPKGTYVPVFEELGRAAPALKISSAPAEISEAQKIRPVPKDNPRFGKLFFHRMATLLVAIAVLALGYWLGRRQLSSGVAAANAKLSSSSSNEPAKAFWAALLGNDRTPIIAHADAVFLLDSYNDLFWFPHGESGYRGAVVDPSLAQQYAANPALVAKAGRLYYENSYLGSGDTDAIGILANLFGQLGLRPIIEAGSNLTPEDLKQHNVILVGSSFQSYAVAQFFTTGDFTFEDPKSRQQDWSGLIVNGHPRPGEQQIYRTERDPVSQVVKVDHALITVEPGIISGRYIVDLGGLDTTGSEGAALFATSANGVEELSKALAAQGVHGANGGPALFQALLSVQLEKGNEVLGTSLVAVHPLTHNDSGRATPKQNIAATR